MSSSVALTTRTLQPARGMTRRLPRTCINSAAIGLDGNAELPAADPSLGEQPDSTDLLIALYEEAKDSAARRRAVAFAADVRIDGSDAIRVDLEHRDGATLQVLAPYSRSRFKKTVSIGQLTVSEGRRRVWT